MHQKYILVIIIVAFINFIFGCTTTNLVVMEDSEIDITNQNVLTMLSSNRITSLERSDGVRIYFGTVGARFFEKYDEKDSVIVGLDIDAKSSVTQLRHVRRIWIEETNVNIVKTLGIFIGIPALLAVVTLFIIAARVGQVYDD